VLTWTVVARFPIPGLKRGFFKLMAYMNEFRTSGVSHQLDSAWHRFLSCQCDRRDTPHIAANAGTLIRLPKFWLRRAACLQLSNNPDWLSICLSFCRVIDIIKMLPATLVCCNFFRSGCGLVVANVSVIFLSKWCATQSPPCLQPGDHRGVVKTCWWQQ